MATKASNKQTSRFSSVLSAALFEWILILLLFLDALFSYLVTKFSRLCKLQTPCLLCSRLDHFLGKEKADFYWNLICCSHKSEISSLAFCRVHGKLANVHSMCEVCLLSFATEKKSNSETYRSLVGKLGVDLCGHEYADRLGIESSDHHECNGDDVICAPLLKADKVSPELKICSCCSALFESKPHVDDATELFIAPLDRSRHNHLHEEDDGMSKTRQLAFSPAASPHLRNQDSDRFTHIGYSEVKVNSDSESESEPLSDDDGITEAQEASNMRQDFACQCQTRQLSFSPAPSPHLRNQNSDRFTHIGYSEVKVNSDSESESEPLSDDNGITKAQEASNMRQDFACQCPEPDQVISIQKSLSADLSEEFSQERFIHPAVVVPTIEIPERKLYVAEACEFAAFSSSNYAAIGSEELNWSHVEIKDNTEEPETGTQDAQDVVEALDDIESIKVVAVTTDTTSAPNSTNEFCSLEINTKTEQCQSYNAPVNSQMDLNDAYKLAVGTRGSLTSPTFAEIIKGKDSAKIQEDFRLLVSQFSAARGLESPWHEMGPSPRALEQGEESVLQNITKTVSLERNESGLESLDGSLIGEMEGESTFDRLKRQIDLDKKSISLLYKELEEERNASAIAANQAMAMITKLQEEKAAMQMEAFQYQRMMEEQAEYDQDALQQYLDLLAQKEKETQNLEVELDILRKHFIDDPSVNKVLEQVGKDVESVQKLDRSDMASQVTKSSGVDSLVDPLLCLDDERAYISDCLMKLEEKLHLFSNYGVYLDGSPLASDEREHGKANGDYCVQSDGICQDSNGDDCLRLTTVIEDYLDVNGVYLEKMSSESMKDAHCQTSSHFSVEKENDQENHHETSESISNENLKVVNQPDLVAFKKEASQLRQRLEALEADRNFLEHALNLLRNGNDGIQFIREIASDLRELREIGIKRPAN